MWLVRKCQLLFASGLDIRDFIIVFFVSPNSTTRSVSMALPEPEHQDVVTINFPGGREFQFVEADSPLRQWQVGQAVTFRGSSWLVVARSESAGSLSLSLGGGSPAV